MKELENLILQEFEDRKTLFDFFLDLCKLNFEFVHTEKPRIFVDAESNAKFTKNIWDTVIVVSKYYLYFGDHGKIQANQISNDSIIYRVESSLNAPTNPGLINSYFESFIFTLTNLKFTSKVGFISSSIKSLSSMVEELNLRYPCAIIDGNRYWFISIDKKSRKYYYLLCFDKNKNSFNYVDAPIWNI